MPNWKTTVRLGDLHNAYEIGNMKISEVAKALAGRLRKNRFSEDIGDLIVKFEKVRSVSSYDACLRRLYDFADSGHKIWLDPTR